MSATGHISNPPLPLAGNAGGKPVSIADFIRVRLRGEADIPAELDGELGADAAPEDCATDERLLVAVASQLYHMRRSRDRLMPKGLMGEPAWDVLLALFSEEPDRVTLSAVSQASGVPPSSACRWIDLLSAEGLVERIAHPRDANLMFVSLTAKGRASVRECLGALCRAADD